MYNFNKHSDHSVGGTPWPNPKFWELLQAERSELPLLQADGMVLEMKFLGILTIPNDGYSMVLMGKIGRSNDVLDSQKMVLMVFHTD